MHFSIPGSSIGAVLSRRDTSPGLPTGDRHVLLFLPCTKTKPYPFSLEHKRINQALHAAGFRPTGSLMAPRELTGALESEFAPEVLNFSPLRDRSGTVIHRVVVSEPLGVVPYEHIMTYDAKPSPASAYDDPGLFENWGNAVSPWRKDFSATRVSETQWKWGDSERRAYVAMHNEMSDWIARFVARLAGRYTDRVAWVALVSPTAAFSSAAMNGRRITSRRSARSATNGCS